MSFNIDEIKTIIKQVIHDKIGENEFEHEHVRQWNIDILTDILHRLEQIQYIKNPQQIKYVVTVLIGEKKKQIDVGLHTALACLWNGTTDGCVTVKWENKSVFAITSVFGLAV